MTDKIKLVQGDTRPHLQLAITDENTGAVVDITGATVVMKFRAVGSATILDTLSGAVTDGTGGKVVIPWNQTTLAVPPGDYEGEVQVTFSAGQGIQTVYDVLKFKVREEF